MNIVLGFWYAQPHIGGVETYLTQLAHSLRSRGTTVSQLAGTEEAADAVYVDVLDRRKPLTAAVDLTPWDRAVRQGSPTIFHLHNMHVLAPDRAERLLPALKEAWPNVPILASIHNYSSTQSLGVLRRCDAVAVHSEFMRNVIRVHGQETELLPCAFPLIGSPRRMTKRKRTPLIVQPTRFSWWKGSYLTIAAFLEMRRNRRDVELLHCGVSWNDAQQHWDARAEQKWPGLQDAAARLVAGGSLRFEALTVAETRDMIERADVVVHPTLGAAERGEPYGISAAQAILAGRPLVATASGHLSDLLDGYPPGVVLTETNSPALARELLAVLADPPPACHSSPAQRRIITDIESSVPAHLALYRRLAG